MYCVYITRACLYVGQTRRAAYEADDFLFDGYTFHTYADADAVARSHEQFWGECTVHFLADAVALKPIGYVSDHEVNAMLADMPATA